MGVINITSSYSPESQLHNANCIYYYCFFFFYLPKFCCCGFTKRWALLLCVGPKDLFKIQNSNITHSYCWSWNINKPVWLILEVMCSVLYLLGRQNIHCEHIQFFIHSKWASCVLVISSNSECKWCLANKSLSTLWIKWISRDQKIWFMYLLWSSGWFALLC